MTDRYHPRYPRLGQLAAAVAGPPVRAAAMVAGLRDGSGGYAQARLARLRAKLQRGEPALLLGLGVAGHNAAASLVEVSEQGELKLLCSNEEERYSGVKHDGQFPTRALEGVRQLLERRSVSADALDAVLTSWDYPRFALTVLRHAIEEAPTGLRLLRREASPHMNVGNVLDAMAASGKVGRALGMTRRVPLVMQMHHDNHASFSYAASPFAHSDEPTLVAVIDGYGDHGHVSFYVGRTGRLELRSRGNSLFDSLGLLYSVISSTQGGWTTLSSEGRYMGAAAWGDGDRASNRWYQRIRPLLRLDGSGQVRINRNLINYNREGEANPYRPALAELLGAPIPRDRMWNPDAVLNVEQVAHEPITRERVDKAAALQLLFEDGLLHVLEHQLRESRCARLVLTGGTALNCVANMRLLETFDERFYAGLNLPGRRLHLWVPPVPSDCGVALGSAYSFAMKAGARPGAPLTHAFHCGEGVRREALRRELGAEREVGACALTEGREAHDLDRLADFMAFVLSRDGVLGLFQGAAEMGPRALGHRSILANPTHPETLAILNRQVKFRERIRPLAPMVTLESARRLFELSDGASDDDYAAYNYMVLTARARPEARRLIPAAVHHDGTSRLQIVRREVDPLCHALLLAMERRVGVAALVNTSLNVGSPIVQTVAQACEAMRRAASLDALVFLPDDGGAMLAWHAVHSGLKDGGTRLLGWLSQWRTECGQQWDSAA